MLVNSVNYLEVYSFSEALSFWMLHSQSFFPQRRDLCRNLTPDVVNVREKGVCIQSYRTEEINYYIHVKEKDMCSSERGRNERGK